MSTDNIPTPDGCEWLGRRQCNGATCIEWWDGDDAPKMVMTLPTGLVWTPSLEAALEFAYGKGHDAGETWGRSYAQHDMRKALGL